MNRDYDRIVGPMIRDALKHHDRISLVRSDVHGWQANMKRPDGTAYAVECDPDPIVALMRVLAPQHTARVETMTYEMNVSRSDNDPLKQPRGILPCADLFRPF